MYLERKIDSFLLEWKNKERKNPALIIGIRQCGKTKSILEFGKKNYPNVLFINFWDQEELKSDFDGSLDIDTIISNLSLRFRNIKIVPKETLIIFDEIQECPRARYALKNFALDGRYDVIATGSYLGIHGYILGDNTPVPVGYEDIYEMKTMDFEEFLWANDFTKKQIEELYSYFAEKKKIPDNIHQIYKDIFLKYICVGGFPRAVQEYVLTKNLYETYKITQNIVKEMKGDFGRRKDKKGSPLFKSNDVARITQVFDLIPTFLSKENKRFIVSHILRGSTSEKLDAIEFLKEAHIVHKVYNLEAPSLPLKGNAVQNQFKLFTEDISIVTSLFGIDTIIGLNQGNLGMHKGALYEAITFDALFKADIEPYYFAKASGLKIDFVINYEGFSTLVETKAKNGNTKASKTILYHPDHYGKTRLIKIGDYNIGYENEIFTIPHYLTFFLGRKKEFH